MPADRVGPVGLFEETAFDEETIQLAPGDLIVTFSDGVSEAENEAEDMFGDERLLAAVAACRGGSAQAMLDTVLEHVRAFCGKALPNDDATVIVVRYGQP